MEVDKLINRENFLKENYFPKQLYTLDNNENNFHKAINPCMKPCLDVRVVPYYILLREEAKRLGFNIIVDSGFRSYTYQQAVFEDCLKTKGLSATLNSVAVPGASEHQSGLAFDYGYIRNKEFSDDVREEDPEYKWLKENAHKLGFIIRYPKGKEDITEYKFEPWHLRFVGINLAMLMHKYDLTLEEYHQNKDKYLTELKKYPNPQFKTFAELGAALLCLKGKFELSKLEKLGQAYHQAHPDVYIISSSLEYLLNIGYQDNEVYLTDQTNTLELSQLAQDELLEFTKNYLVISR